MSVLGLEFLSTLSLRRATLDERAHDQLAPISIHALLAESDYSGHLQSALLLDFYPRSPCGERPPRCGWLEVIHYFYPRSPCGERRHSRQPNIPSA